MSATSASLDMGELAGRPVTILLVEDDFVVRSTCSHALRCAGYAVEAVADGITAWDALRTHPVDLLVTDNQMPCLNGEELILRARRFGMTLPIIGITASDKFFSSEVNERLANAVWLKKPFGIHEILDAIRQALGDPDPRPD